MTPTKQKSHKSSRPRAIFLRRHLYPDGAHPAEMYLETFTGESQRAMRSALDSIADILSNGKVGTSDLAWHELRIQHVSALRARMLELMAPATINRYLTAVRGVMKAAWRLKLIDRESMEQTIDVAPARGKRELKGRVVGADEIQRLFETCSADSNESIGVRDAAILAVLYGTGMRRAETASALLENFDETRGCLRVIGKGNKERDVFLPNGALAAVEAWLVRRGHEPGPLFTKVRKNGIVTTLPISAALVYRMLQRRHLVAGVEPFTPHDLRRSFISELLDKGVDITTVARQVGHSNGQTTARYDRRDSDAQRDVVMQLNVPFGK